MFDKALCWSRYRCTVGLSNWSQDMKEVSNMPSFFFVFLFFAIFVLFHKFDKCFCYQLTYSWYHHRRRAEEQREREEKLRRREEDIAAKEMSLYLRQSKNFVANNRYILHIAFYVTVNNQIHSNCFLMWSQTYLSAFFWLCDFCFVCVFPDKVFPE